MKYAFVAIALAAAVHAQTIDDVPECAIPCLDDAITSETDCATDDYACVCENFDSIQGVATSCVISECGAETALNEVLPAVEALCENAGSEPTSAEPTEEPTSAVESETATATETVVVPTEEPTETGVETTVETTFTQTMTKTTECSTTLMPTHAPTNGTGPAPTDVEPSPVPTAGAAAVLPGLALAGLAVLAL